MISSPCTTDAQHGKYAFLPHNRRNFFVFNIKTATVKCYDEKHVRLLNYALSVSIVDILVFKRDTTNINIYIQFFFFSLSAGKTIRKKYRNFTCAPFSGSELCAFVRHVSDFFVFFSVVFFVREKTTKKFKSV